MTNVLAQTYLFPLNNDYASHGTSCVRTVTAVKIGLWCTEATDVQCLLANQFCCVPVHFGGGVTHVHIGCWTRTAGSNDVPAAFLAKATVYVGYYITW